MWPDLRFPPINLYTAPNQTPLSPCVKKCQLENEHCTGCGRSLEQIRDWSLYSTAEKVSIMKKLNESRVMRLAVLSEDCGRTVQSVAKTFQNGGTVEVDYDDLERKIGDVLASAAQLALSGDISWTNVMAHAERRNENLKKVC